MFAEIWRQGLLEYDKVVGIDWSWLAADGAMTKAPLGGAKTGPNPTDRAKKGRNDRSQRGSRRPDWVRARGANRNDQMLLEHPQLIPIERRADRGGPQGLCLDKAYDYPPCVSWRQYELTPHIRTRGDEIADKIRSPGWRARRWVVEATHSWLNRNRGILIRWSKNDENHLALLQLASGLIAFKKGAQLATALPA